MNGKYFYQVVLCSERKARAFRREILTSGTSAMVTGAEKLPPGYEIIMERLTSNEANTVHFLRNSGLKGSSDYQGCPFCGNWGVFHCSCGFASCKGEHKKHHICPHCGDIGETITAKNIPVSVSGLTHEPTRQTTITATQERPRLQKIRALPWKE